MLWYLIVEGMRWICEDKLFAYLSMKLFLWDEMGNNEDTSDVVEILGGGGRSDAYERILYPICSGFHEFCACIIFLCAFLIDTKRLAEFFYNALLVIS